MSTSIRPQGKATTGTALNLPTPVLAQAKKPQLVLLADADAAQCGAKAAACGELARLAAGADADFAAPAAVVVPFGVMDLAIEVCLTACYLQTLLVAVSPTS